MGTNPDQRDDGVTCQGADFSKVMQHLADNLVAHADRDGLTGVMRAVFLARGGHAPGTRCPHEPPPEPPHDSFCSWLLGDDCDCGAHARAGSS